MKKYIIFALITILAAVLFVACENDITVDNNVAYTEVLENDGAFVFAGKTYDSLQEAVDAADKATPKSPAVPKITMTRNAISRAITIPEEAMIELDLGGYELKFVEVEDGAIIVPSDTALKVSNGTVSLFDKAKELAVFKSQGSVYLSGVNVKAEGQIAVIAVDSRVYIDYIDGKSCIFGDVSLSAVEGFAKLYTNEGTKIVGAIIATGKEEGAPNSLDLDLNSVITNLSLTNGCLYVGPTGHVTLTAVGGTNEYVAAEGGSAITTPEGVNIDVEDGICFIERGEGEKKTRTYFGSLREAVAEAKDEEKIVYLANDTQDYSDGITVEKVVGIELNGHNFGYDETEMAEFIVEEGAILIVADSSNVNDITKSKFIASVSGDGSFYVANVEVSGAVEIGEDFISMDAILDDTIKAGTVMDVGSTFNADIETTTGAAEFDNSCFANVSIKSANEVAIYNSTEVIKDITAAEDVTIDNSADEDNIFVTGTIAGVDVKVYSYVDDVCNVVIGSVDASSLTAGSTDKYGAIFAKTITATESVTLNHSHVSSPYTLPGPVYSPSIYAPVISISNSELYVDKMMKSHVENEDPVPATSVIITSSYGNISGSIVASDASSAQTKTVITLSDSYDLTVSTLDADDDNIEIDYVTVEGPVTAGNLTADYARFFDDIDATGLISISNAFICIGASANENKFVKTTASDTSSSKAIELTNVIFEKSDSNYFNIRTLKGGSIRITDSTGYAGTIFATNDNTAETVGSVVIDNSGLEDTNKLDTQVVGSEIGTSVYGNVTLTGHDNAEYLKVVGVVGNVLDFDYVYVSGSVTAFANDSSSKGYVYSTRSIFDDNVVADFVIDGDKDLSIAGSTFRSYVDASVMANFWNSNVGNDSDVVSDIVFIEDSIVNVEDIFGGYGTGYSPIPATNVSVKSSTGSIDSILASDGNDKESTTVVALSTPYYSETEFDQNLEVGSINTGLDNIEITGNGVLEPEPFYNAVFVYRDVVCNDFDAEFAIIDGDITASGLITIDTSFIGYGDEITIESTEGDIEISNVMFNAGNSNISYYANLKATDGGVSIEHAEGYLGSIVSKDLSISDAGFVVVGFGDEDVAVKATGNVSIDGGLFEGSVFLSGSGVITGGDFEGSVFLSGEIVIRSADFKASSVEQLNTIGTHISQDNSNDMVRIWYEGNLDGGTAIVRSSSSIERIMLYFTGVGDSDYSILTGNKTTLIFGQFVDADGCIYAPSKTYFEPAYSDDPVLVAVGRSLYGCVFDSTDLTTHAPMKEVGSECWYRNSAW